MWDIKTGDSMINEAGKRVIRLTAIFVFAVMTVATLGTILQFVAIPLVEHYRHPLVSPSLKLIGDDNIQVISVRWEDNPKGRYLGITLKNASDKTYENAQADVVFLDINNNRRSHYNNSTRNLKPGAIWKINTPIDFSALFVQVVTSGAQKV